MFGGSTFGCRSTVGRGSQGREDGAPKGPAVPGWPDCRVRRGTDKGQRGAAGEPGDAGAPRLVIRSRSSSNEIEMKPFGLLCDVFLLKSLKLPSM